MSIQDELRLCVGRYSTSEAKSLLPRAADRIDQLEKELAEARKDAERLDAIEKNARCDPKMNGEHVWWPTTWRQQLKGPTLRAAIDAAMEQK